MATAAISPPRVDDAEKIEQMLRRLISPGQCFEIRAPKWTPPNGGKPKNNTRFFTHDTIPEAAAHALEITEHAVAVYVTLNPVAPGLEGPAKDHDVDRRSWILVDTDPKRPSDTSSTQAEKTNAFFTLGKIKTFLDGRLKPGEDRVFRPWPEPVELDSANGFHALYPCDLPNDDESRDLIKSLLKALDEKFGDNDVEVDTKVFNASRITKVCATWARKGDNTEDRPHRRSQLLACPAGRRRVTADDIREALSFLSPKPAVLDLGPEIERKQSQAEAGPKKKNKLAKGMIMTATSSTPEARAIAWLAKAEPSVSGQRGHDALLWAAKVGVFFGLTEEETFRILSDHYNVPGRCEPVWPESDVRRKVAEARRLAAPDDWRKLVDADRKSSINGNGRNGAHHVSAGRGATPTFDQNQSPDPGENDPGGPSRLAPTQGVVEAPDDPHRLGRTFVNEEYFHEEHPRIVRHLDDFYEWRDGCYRPVPEGVAADNLTAAIKSQFDEICLEEMERYWKAKEEYDQKMAENPDLKAKPPKLPLARKVTGKVHNDTMRALRSMVAIPHEPIPPFWLSRDETNPDPKQVLPTVDGLVDLSSLTISDGTIDLNEIKVYDPTPALFCPYALSYSFDPDFPKPSRWLEFVKQVFPKDKASRRELQKWFGLLISPDTSYQKILYLIGKTRSGKGTILRVLTHLIGAANITSPALVELAQNFGLSDCLGKSVMLISDARIAGDDGALALLQERLLKISGEDAVQVNRKNRDMFTTKLPLRIVIASNSVPSFRDPGGAFRSRMRPLLFLESFEGREDARLFEDKLVPEMPGILNWAIIGKAMLAEDGGFNVPESAADLVQSLSESNPTQMFVDECCDTTQVDAITTKEDMFVAFQWWCQKTRNHVPPIQIFGKNLFATVPEIQEARAREKVAPGQPDRRPPAYRGIALRDNARSASTSWNLQREQGRGRV